MFFQFQENAQWSEGFLATNVKKCPTKTHYKHKSVEHVHRCFTSHTHIGHPTPNFTVRNVLGEIPSEQKRATHDFTVHGAHAPKSKHLDMFPSRRANNANTHIGSGAKAHSEPKKFNGIVFSTHAHDRVSAIFLEPKAHQRYEMTQTCND